MSELVTVVPKFSQNPALGKYMLLPHYEYQVAGLYPNTWAVHDMGSSYPRALGHNDGVLDTLLPDQTQLVTLRK